MNFLSRIEILCLFINNLICYIKTKTFIEILTNSFSLKEQNIVDDFKKFQLFRIVVSNELMLLVPLDDAIKLMIQKSY